MLGFMRERQLLDRERCALVGEGPERIVQRQRGPVEVEVHEDEAAPGVDSHGRQGDFVHREVLVAEVAGRAQPPVESVGPAVIAAHQAGHTPAAIVDEWTGAVAADVVVSAHLTLVIHDDQH